MKRKWGFILRDRIAHLTLMNNQILNMIQQDMKLLVIKSSNQELLTRLTVTRRYVSTVTGRYVSTNYPKELLCHVQICNICLGPTSNLWFTK